MDKIIMCEERVYGGGRSSFRGHPCTNRAVVAELDAGRQAGLPARYRPLCTTHKKRALRARTSPQYIVDLTPEVVAAIRDQEAQQQKAYQEERARKNAEAEVSRQRWTADAQAETPQPWSVTRDDEHDLDWDATRKGSTPVYKDIPRWVVTPEGGNERWGSNRHEVKIIDLFGEARIQLSGGSPARLTPNAAEALVRALTEARLLIKMRDQVGPKPTGVSVQVKLPSVNDYHAIGDAGLALAREQYPSANLTGKVLHVGYNEFEPDVHEVVLEVTD